MFRKADAIPDRVQMMARWFVMIESIELRGHCCRDSRCRVWNANVGCEGNLLLVVVWRFAHR